MQAATSGGGPTVSAARPLPEKKAYLLKRYREEIPPDSIFYVNSRSVFALPEAFSQSQAVLDDIDASIPHIFRFEKGTVINGNAPGDAGDEGSTGASHPRSCFR